MSVLIAAVGKTVRSVSGIAQIVIQFMAAVGGSFIPVAQFPPWLQPLHYVTGQRLGHRRLPRGDAGRHRGLAVLPNVGALALMGVVFFAAGATRLRWE